ncbi:MAG: CpaE family protein [Alphaproteobacteria bacterium]
MKKLLITISDRSLESWAQSVAQVMGVATPWILVGGPQEATRQIISQQIVPTHIVLELGARGAELLPEIDALGEQCVSGTRVVAAGTTNDIHLYRNLLARGVLDYLPMPVAAQDIARALEAPATNPNAARTDMRPQASEKRVIAMMSAASGDGASTIALNTAYAISEIFEGRTVLVDMDYQFGMVAKNINLQSQYGIRELFEHPERGIDATLIRRMVAQYQHLHVITAPSDLRFLPSLSAQAIPELVGILKQSYDTIILDLPHVWLPWVATACQSSTHLVLVAQLWLKSVTHSARLLKAWREHQIPTDQVTLVINRSGAKFKEAIEPRDFERVCGVAIKHMVTNDIRTVVQAEGEAKTIMELPTSKLGQDIGQLARLLIGISPTIAPTDKLAEKSGLIQTLTRLTKKG